MTAQKNAQTEHKQFKNPPIVELIAELRWGTPPVMEVTPGKLLELPIGSFSAHELFYKKFADKIAGNGYSQLERLIPEGFPSMPFQPVYRYRKSKEVADSTLYQLGVGIFTANVVPPYQSWVKFRPILENGIKLLLESFAADPNKQNINAINLRYINAFKESLLKGEGAKKFITETLGFKIELPQAILDQTTSSDEVKPLLKLSIPLKSNHQMMLTVAEGKVNEDESILMDIAVSLKSEFDQTADAIMRTFDEAHNSIYTVFVGITEKIHDVMGIK